MAETRRYFVVPITPVFTGTGNSLGPDEYYIDGKTMVRFHTANVVRAMHEAERRELEQLMDGGRMAEGVKLLREAAKRHETKTTAYRMPAGEAFRERVGRLDDRSSQAVQTMAHTLENGKAIIPGTAIKGAIRTAILSGWLSEQPERQRRIGNAVWEHGGRDGLDSRDVEAEIAAFSRNSLEADPFRYLRVRDVSVDTKSMRVDSFFMVGRDGLAKGGDGQRKGVPLFGERLESCVDGPPDGERVEISDEAPMVLPSAGVVEISIETEKRQDHRVEKVFGNARVITFSDQAAKCREFYRNRLLIERERFPSLYWWYDKVIDGLVARKGMLLRIGRHSHFESASLEGVRRGTNIQLRTPIKEGSTRTVCYLRNGYANAPMGWVWLVRA